MHDESLIEDPVYRNTLREAWVILGMWLVCLLYCCTWCYLTGYTSHPRDPGATGPSLGQLAGELPAFDRDPESLETPLGLGIPDWVFYGIVVPWLVCIALTFWFCLFYFVEDDLGEEQPSPADRPAEGSADA